MTNSLSYFRVDGSYLDVEQPIPDTIGSITPQIDEISAYVDFFPGTLDDADEIGFQFIAPNYVGYAADTEIAIAPITARVYNGVLSSITIGDPVGAELVSNAPWMALDEDLYYHVRYRNVTYGGALQRFSNFAFKAPADSTGVRLTSKALQRFSYRGP